MKYAIRKFANRQGYDLIRNGRLGFSLVSMQRGANAPSGASFIADIARRITSSAPVFFDVGANLGFTSRRIRDAFPNSHIHAFEPSRSTFERLVAGCAGMPNFRAWNCGLGATRREPVFEENEIPTMSSFLPLSAFGTGQIKQHSTVDIRTVDDVCMEAGIARIDVLKSDTQGFELEVLRGAQGMISKGAIGMVYLEVIFSDMYKGLPRFTEVCDFMLDRDFRIAALYPTAYQKDLAGWTDMLLIHASLYNGGERNP
jgi:FkbM family methyltransferase